MSNSNAVFIKYTSTPIISSQLSVCRANISGEASYYREYIKDNQKKINDRETSFIAVVDKIRYESGYEEEGSEAVIKYEYESQLFHAQVFYKSTLLMLYSLFSHGFRNICKTIEVNTNCSIKLNDISGKDMEQNRKYLEKLFLIDLKDLNDEWSRLLDYEKIRHCIVHNNSDVNLNQGREKDLRRIISKSEYLKYKDKYEDEFLISDVNYLLDYCKLIEKFLIKTVEKVSSRYKEK